MQGFVNVLLENWRQAILGGLIVVSAVIVIMGLIKKLFNKIQNKLLRKFLLALTSIVMVLPISAIYFVSAGIDYKYFWADYGLLSAATVVTYWLYENTCLRELIHKIGSKTIGKFITFFIGKIKRNDNIEDDMNDLKNLTEGLQKDVQSQFSSFSLPTVQQEEKIRIPISSIPTIKLTPNRSLEQEQNELKKL